MCITTDMWQDSRADTIHYCDIGTLTIECDSDSAGARAQAAAEDDRFHFQAKPASAHSTYIIDRNEAQVGARSRLKPVIIFASSAKQFVKMVTLQHLALPIRRLAKSS